MATIYKINIKTVSAFCAYDEEYIKKMFDKFLKEYRDEKTQLGFESTEIDVNIVGQESPSKLIEIGRVVEESTTNGYIEIDNRNWIMKLLCLKPKKRTFLVSNVDTSTFIKGDKLYIDPNNCGMLTNKKFN